MYDFDTVVPRINCGSEKWDDAIKNGLPADITPLSVADMEFKSAPEIIEALHRTVDFGMWGYTYGDDSLRNAACEWMKKRHGWVDVNPSWIVNTPGVVPAIATAVKTFTKEGDGIIIQPPVYPPFANVVNNNGRKLLENPLIKSEKGYSIDFEDFEAKAADAKMFILCSPHNPIGRVWTREELLKIAEICLKNNIIVFCDEIHCDIIMPGHEFVPFGSLGEKYNNIWISGTSVSKTFSLAGLACSSIFIANTDLKKQFISTIKKDYSQFNSTFGRDAAIAAYTKAEPWLDELIKYINGNYNYIKKIINTNIPKAFIADLEGTYLTWIDLSCLGMDDDKLHEFLQKEALFYCNNGSAFGKQGSRFIRINLACPRCILEDAMNRLIAAISQL